MRWTVWMIVTGGVAMAVGATQWSGAVGTPPHGAVPEAMASSLGRASGSSYYVAPDGRPESDGSRERPWDIVTAFAGGQGRIQPGDTVWLRRGRYLGPFTSQLTGTPEAPIIVRQLPGERATLDNRSGSKVTLRITGQWGWYWGFEVTNSSEPRTVYRPNGVYPRAPNNRFINLVVHDNNVGVSFSNESRNSEVYGCIIYNNGYNGEDRTHGHGIYAKNDGSTQKVVRDNIVFNQFRNGIQVYTDAGTGQLRNILLEGNVWFNNGTLTGTRYSAANILVGGKEVADQIILRGNLTYYSPGIEMRNVRIGYTNDLENGRATVHDNYFVGGEPVLVVGHWREADLRGNVFVGAGGMVAMSDLTLDGMDWRDNVHWHESPRAGWSYRDTTLAFAAWQQLTHTGDRAVAGVPGETQVFVRPNAYEAGRAHIIVYNWSLQATVAVDVSTVLRVGDHYLVHNVQDYFGRPAAEGVYDGEAVMLPMVGVDPPAPVGGAPGTPPRTGPAFDVFVLTVVPGMERH